MQATRPEVLERFWSHVEPTGFCWLWTGCLNRNGYGAARVGGVGGAHRVAYEILVGPIPEGMQLDHLCRVRACVNPDHLEVVTAQQNIRRIPGKGLAYCGFTVHPKTPENTRVSRGREMCRTCANEHRRRKVECPICGTLVAANGRAKHVNQVHHGKVPRTECPHCGHVVRRSDLAYHVRSKHPELAASR